jgi:WD40 repeat protein
MAQMQREIEQLKTPLSLHRDSMPGTVSKQEHEAALAEHEAALAEKERYKAEVAKLRQVVTSAKAVSDDEKLLRVLATVDDAEGESPQASGPPSAPADRTLRQTAAGAGMAGGLYFTPDAQTLVHGGREAKDTELSLWDLRSRKRTSGGVKRGAAVLTSAVSPDGQLLCVAAVDGLAMFEFTPRSSDGDGGGVEEPRCEPLWEIATGTRFAGVAFSRDSRLVAAVRWETGQLEIRDARSNSAVKVIEDFPAVHGDGHNCLAFSEEVLAVGGGSGKPYQ